MNAASRIYDYIIVGGGSAGCVLANRLSADPSVRVCLLEAGPADRSPFIHMPIGIMALMMSRTLNWRYFTEPQPELGGRRLFWPRGKMLGGSSSSNAMVYMRGHRADYDHWAALGNAGWSYDDLLPLFRAGEHNERGADAFHGVGGPLNVADQRSPNRLAHVYLEAARQAGYRANPDFNGAEQEGVALYQLTQKNGRRWSATRAYLRPALGRSNLTVVTRARATRILFEGKRAVGVAYRQGRHEHTVRALHEVLLAGGAINSPQLLMLSGVGDPAELARHGIALVHALPGVGQNLQDHLDVLVVQRCIQPVSLGISRHNVLAQGLHLLNYLLFKNGPLTTNGAEGGGFIKSDPTQPAPDLQLHFTPAMLHEHGHTLAYAKATLLGHGYALHVCGLRPKSRGRIGLHSADPLADALIDPRYLSHPDDIETLLKGVKAVRRILAAPAFDAFRGEELFPGPQAESDESIRAFIRARAGTIYHPVGTCKMGGDPLAVVDARLRVHGVQGLRVVDASIMPTLIGGNTNAPAMIIGEKGARMILQDRVVRDPVGRGAVPFGPVAGIPAADEGAAAGHAAQGRAAGDSA